MAKQFDETFNTIGQMGVDKPRVRYQNWIHPRRL